jgi:hypothetical protein
VEFRSVRRAGIPALLVLFFAIIGIFLATSQSLVAASKGAKPLMKLMALFTASDVPQMGPAEIEAPPIKDPKPPATGLPGKGMAEHPMLYVGEGYNKILVVDHGKIIWTYSTVPGWEYDDVWMLSNGNILFSRMQYVAEVTPDKKVVWRHDAPHGTEIHDCQPIGQDKVLFISPIFSRSELRAASELPLSANDVFARSICQSGAQTPDRRETALAASSHKLLRPASVPPPTHAPDQRGLR